MKRIVAATMVLCMMLLMVACGPKHTHSYVGKVTAPTCTEAGYTTYTCECGDSYQQDSVAATGHNWKDATCETAKTCTICNATEGNPNGHKYSAATCTTAKTCSVCNETEGDAAGHNWQNATCSSPKTCKQCGKTEGSVIDHNYQNGNCTMCNAKDPKVQQIADANYAYSNLLIAEQYCDLFSSMIYDAWYFAIYKSDDYTSGSKAIKAFSSYVGLDSNLVTEGVDSYLKKLGYSVTDLYRCAVLGTNNGALYVVHYALTSNGYFANAEVCINDAKEYIRKLDSSYASVNAYSELSSYYSAVSAYYDFCYSPSGSFSKLSGTVSTFRDNCGFYRNKCSLYF